MAIYDGRDLFVHDMPTHMVVVSRKDRRAIDERATLDRVQRASLFGAQILVIEQVSGMPGQSGPAAFTFGYGVGVVTTAALACGMTVERVAPSRWKAALGLKSADKAAARKLAAEMFPAQAALFARVKDDGRAEAVLIAKYGWLTRGAL